MLPNPGKSKGSIDLDCSTSFRAYIGEVSKESKRLPFVCKLYGLSNHAH